MVVARDGHMTHVQLFLPPGVKDDDGSSQQSL